MSSCSALAAEFGREGATTRKYLERFPEEHADYRPHDKSMDLAQLTCHVIEIPHWSGNILRDPGLDFAQTEYRPLGLRTRKDLLAKHAEITQKVIGLLSEATDEALGETWRLSTGDQLISEAPRADVMREFVLSHLVHHRGQLGVYYRLLDIPVPGAYGPSADDQQD